jgi:hypothetical protein
VPVRRRCRPRWAWPGWAGRRCPGGTGRPWCARRQQARIRRPARRLVPGVRGRCRARPGWRVRRDWCWLVAACLAFARRPARRPTRPPGRLIPRGRPGPWRRAPASPCPRPARLPDPRGPEPRPLRARPAWAGPGPAGMRPRAPALTRPAQNRRAPPRPDRRGSGRAGAVKRAGRRAAGRLDLVRPGGVRRAGRCAAGQPGLVRPGAVRRLGRPAAGRPGLVRPDRAGRRSAAVRPPLTCRPGRRARRRRRTCREPPACRGRACWPGRWPQRECPGVRWPGGRGSGSDRAARRTGRSRCVPWGRQAGLARYGDDRRQTRLVAGRRRQGGPERRSWRPPSPPSPSLRRPRRAPLTGQRPRRERQPVQCPPVQCPPGQCQPGQCQPGQCRPGQRQRGQCPPRPCLTRLCLTRRFPRRRGRLPGEARTRSVAVPIPWAGRRAGRTPRRARSPRPL